MGLSVLSSVISLRNCIIISCVFFFGVDINLKNLTILQNEIPMLRVFDMYRVIVQVGWFLMLCIINDMIL